MIAQDVLQLLRCPLTHQCLSVCDATRIQVVNRAIEAGQVFTRGGERVTEPVQEALLTQDGRRLYPVQNGIVRLLADGAIEFEFADHPTGP
jgi:uncharacterized protein YbaR (Trm112 family)